ncbi:TPA: hypothetical protein JAJ38_002371 [Legionella pneumophila]|nr:hypothetical protein [Legionella pneumophila]HAT6335092.1 hypothetical protein [Legionella pneumophila]
MYIPLTKGCTSITPSKPITMREYVGKEMVLAHTVCVCINKKIGNPPLQFALLLKS